MRLYLESHPVYLSAILTGWVFAFGGYSDEALWRLPRRIREAFTVDDARYDRDADRFHRRLCNPWITLPPAAVLSAAFVAFVFAWPDLWGIWFPEDFAGANLRNAIVAINGTIIVFLGVSMLWGFWSYVRYALRVFRYRTIVSVPAARVFLRPITTFGLVTGIGWSIAVTLFVSSFTRDFNLFAVLSTVVFGLLGFGLIVLPQVLMHGLLQREHDQLLQLAARELRRESLDPSYLNAVATGGPETAAARLETGLERLSATSTWIHSPRDVFALAGQLLLPAIAIAVTVWVQS